MCVDNKLPVAMIDYAYIDLKINVLNDFVNILTLDKNPTIK